MEKLRKVLRLFVDLIEVYLPCAMFVLLFLVFLTNVVFRYVLKNPQNWTFELSVNAFVVVGLLGASTAYRQEDHVVFDLLYTRLSAKRQNILRVLSHAIVIVFFMIALPSTIKSIIQLPSVTSIMRIPEWLIFMALPIFMVSTVLRSAYRMFLDLKAFKDRSYTQTYNVSEKEILI